MNTTTDFISEQPTRPKQPPQKYSLNRFYAARAKVLELMGTAIRNLDPVSLNKDSQKDLQFWFDTLLLYRSLWDECVRIQRRLDSVLSPADKLTVLECTGDEFHVKLSDEPMTVKHMYMCSIFSYVSGNTDGSIWGDADVE